MKIIFKLVILGLVVVVVFNYIAYQKSGNIPVRNWVENAQKAFSKFHNDDASADANKTVKVSKWTDTKGVVHYENRPVDGAKTLEVEPDTNVLPAIAPVELPASADEKPKSKTMDEEMQALRAAKQAQMDAIINR